MLPKLVQSTVGQPRDLPEPTTTDKSKPSPAIPVNEHCCCAYLGRTHFQSMRSKYCVGHKHLRTHVSGNAEMATLPATAQDSFISKGASPLLPQNTTAASRLQPDRAVNADTPPLLPRHVRDRVRRARRLHPWRPMELSAAKRGIGEDCGRDHGIRGRCGVGFCSRITVISRVRQYIRFTDRSLLTTSSILSEMGLWLDLSDHGDPIAHAPW